MTKLSSQNAIAELGLAGKYTGIENRVVEISVELPELSPASVDGRFFYLSFRRKEPTIEEFVDFIYFKIIPFCIPRSKRKEFQRKYEETQDDRYHVELSDKARHLFIKATQSLKRSGEPGELILFTFLEAFFDAPQLACKMYLKTSENMPVHGSDSVHIKYQPHSGNLILFWGESKLYQDFSSSLDQICASLANFTQKKDGRSPRDRDIDIIKDHADVEDPETLSALLDYFDPYSSQVNQRREVYCCLSGFDYSLYKELAKIQPDDVEAYFRANYTSYILKACQDFREKIIENGIDHLIFNFILLPFRSVVEFRNLFYAKLGFKPSDSLDVDGGQEQK